MPGSFLLSSILDPFFCGDVLGDMGVLPGPSGRLLVSLLVPNNDQYIFMRTCQADILARDKAAFSGQRGRISRGVCCTRDHVRLTQTEEPQSDLESQSLCTPSPMASYSSWPFLRRHLSPGHCAASICVLRRARQQCCRIQKVSRTLLPGFGVEPTYTLLCRTVDLKR